MVWLVRRGWGVLILREAVFFELADAVLLRYLSVLFIVALLFSYPNDS